MQIIVTRPALSYTINLLYIRCRLWFRLFGVLVQVTFNLLLKVIPVRKNIRRAVLSAVPVLMSKESVNTEAILLKKPDVKSQTGAYAVYDNAVRACAEGYTVFDANGTARFTKQKDYTAIAKEVIQGLWVMVLRERPDLQLKVMTMKRCRIKLMRC